MSEITTSNLEQFKEQLSGNNEVAPADSNKKIITVKKHMVLSVQSDYAGCGHIRNIFWFNYLNAVYGKSNRLNAVVAPYFVTQSDLLVRAKTLWFQRVMSANHIKYIETYKNRQDQFKYKMTYDVDDYVWGHNEEQGGTKDDGVPSYNYGAKNVTEEAKDASIKIMNMMDQVTVSSNYLGDMLKLHGVTTEVKLLKNTVNESFWGMNRRQPIKERITKPKIIWTGSPTHWSEAKKLKGDIDNAWHEYILKSVRDNKIEFMQMGCSNNKAPFFFESIENLPNFHKMGWLNSWQYHLPILEYGAHFSIGPLVDNNFNRSKSDIKMIEAYASGSAFIGNIFSSKMPSPYDDNFINVYDNCSVSDIEDKINEYCEPDKYNEIIKKQYEYMVVNGRYTESPIFVNYLTSLL